MYPGATIAAPKDAIARASANRGKMKQPPTEAALIRFAIKLCYHALALPKLDILAVDELLCGFNGRVVVRAIKLDRADKMAIVADDVNPIIGQLRHPAAGSRPDYAFTGIEWRLFGFRLETKTIPAVLRHQNGTRRRY
jgi:hypothetical protein